RFNISSTGGVTDVTVVASEPAGAFDKAATEAVVRWRYNPKVENAVAVERRGIETLLRFDLPD
ncbi:MAG: TonB family protein, partial [Pseudomonadota bacterium]